MIRLKSRYESNYAPDHGRMGWKSRAKSRNGKLAGVIGWRKERGGLDNKVGSRSGYNAKRDTSFFFAPRDNFSIDSTGRRGERGKVEGMRKIGASRSRNRSEELVGVREFSRFMNSSFGKVAQRSCSFLFLWLQVSVKPEQRVMISAIPRPDRADLSAAVCSRHGRLNDRDVVLIRGGL